MTFLNPFMLFGLLAAGIPIIIHLFNFRKPKKIDFSSLEFLRELEKSAMRRVKIQQWLLLALRILAIACLVLAFAEPVLQGALGEARYARTTSAIVIDNSLSMTLRDTRGGYLDQAKTAAGTIVEAASQGDAFFILETAAESSNRAYFRNRAPALERISEIETRPGAGSLARALRQASLQLDEEENRNKEIYLISDLQRSTLLDSLDNSIPEDVRLILVPIGDRQLVNVGVTDIEIESRIIEAGQPVQMQATVTNFGSERLDEYAASAYLEGERAAQTTVSIEPGESAIVRFSVTPQRRGWLAGEVRLEDDAFLFDNARYYTLNVPETREVLLVEGNGQNTRYVSLALSSDLTRGRVVFNIEQISEQALPATSLADYDVVVLVGPQNLSSGEVSTLQRYIGGGGGVMLFPHEQAVLEDYNSLLAAVQGGRVNGYVGQRGGEQVIARFDRVDLEHPLFEGVFDSRTPGSQIESPDILHEMVYSPGSGNEQALIRNTDGRTFLAEIRYQQGRLLFVTVGADQEWSDLPVRGLFVPLVYRAMYYLSAGGSGLMADVQSQQNGEILVPGSSSGSVIRLVGPDGQEFAPVQRPLFDAVLLEIGEEVDRAGVYDVMEGDNVLRRVAINVNSEESDLTVLSVDDAEQRLEQRTNVDVLVLDPRDGDEIQMVEALEEQRVGIELWNVFLWFALFFLLSEMVVSMQWKRRAVVS